MNKTGPQRKVLVVDDDLKLAAFVARQLRDEGYLPETAMNGQEGLDKAATRPPDLIMLDLSMPVMGGIEALSRLREWYHGPIIVLSASNEEERKVQALDLGADDYLTKPFGLEELKARVRSALRRSDLPSGPSGAGEAVVTIGNIQVDLSRRTVTREGREVSLTRTEFELLRFMATNLGKVLTHRDLLREVWGPAYGEETEYLRTFIKQLRRKLELDPSRPAHLVTQAGIGYRLVP